MDNLLSSRYDFCYKQLLGTGSFENVFKGIDLNTNTQIAVKVIDKEKLTVYGDYLQMALQREIET